MDPQGLRSSRHIGTQRSSRSAVRRGGKERAKSGPHIRSQRYFSVKFGWDLATNSRTLYLIRDRTGSQRYRSFIMQVEICEYRRRPAISLAAAWCEERGEEEEEKEEEVVEEDGLLHGAHPALLANHIQCWPLISINYWLQEKWSTVEMSIALSTRTWNTMTDVSKEMSAKIRSEPIVRNPKFFSTLASLTSHPTSVPSLL